MLLWVLVVQLLLQLEILPLVKAKASPLVNKENKQKSDLYSIVKNSGSYSVSLYSVHLLLIQKSLYFLFTGKHFDEHSC